MMFSLTGSTNWEEHFLQEALELEMKMKEMDIESLAKSKLRLALEMNILSWVDFEKWYCQSLGCTSLKSTLDDEKLDQFINQSKITRSALSELEIWNEDLIPLMQWNGCTYVVGLQYTEKLLAIDDLVFILAPPQILSYLNFKTSGATFDFEKKREPDDNENPTDTENGEPSSSMFDSGNNYLGELNLDPTPKSSTPSPTGPLVDLSALMGPNSGAAPAPAVTPMSSAQNISLDLSAPPQGQQTSMFGTSSTGTSSGSGSNVIPMSPSTGYNKADVNSPIWDFLSERHHEYNFEVKKSFDAFVVLKITKGKTSVFKLDHDLSREGVSTLIFEYEISKTAPFRTVQGTGRTETFAAKDLNMNVGNFTHVCITPLKRGRDVIGFFLGLKRGKLTDQHKTFLTELANEVTAS